MKDFEWEIYTKPNCIFCEKAKEILPSVGVKTYDASYALHRSELLGRLDSISVKATTVPQIFHKGDYVGGFEDLEKYLENTP